MGFSPFVEDSRFKICEAYRIESPKYYHDQEYSEKSLQRYQEFLDDYPNSKYTSDVLMSIETLREKLGRKLYESGILYMKMEEFESAEMSFQKTIDLYYDTKILNKAIQGKIKAMAKKGDLEIASELLLKHKESLINENLFSEIDDEIKNIKLKKSKSSE